MFRLVQAGLSLGDKTAALTVEGGNYYTKYHGIRNEGKTYLGPTGLNAGVMGMNLQKMRDTNFLPRMLGLMKTAKFTKLGDQDILNRFFAEHPQEVLLLSCTFNFRFKRNVSECKEPILADDAVVLHGNRAAFHTREKTPILYKHWNSMDKLMLCVGGWCM